LLPITEKTKDAHRVLLESFLIKKHLLLIENWDCSENS